MSTPAFLRMVLAVGFLAGAWACAAPAWSAPAADRLERFRELARGGLATVEDTGEALDPAAQREIDAILDGEVLDSLRTGGPFASVEFIRERLDAFSGAWGGASLQLQPLGEGLLLGRFRLSPTGAGSSVRLYGSSRGAATLLRAWSDTGVPEVYQWARSPGGGVDFLVSWSTEATGRGSWALRLELWRMRGGKLSPVWRSAEQYPDGLWVSHATIAPGRIVLRRELRYPGWKPGCDAHAEQEDRYRSAGPGGGVAPAGHEVFNGWHRELGSSVSRMFSALASGDRRTLADLVPDAAVRARLPAGLRPEPACDFQNPDAPATAVVAAAVPLRSGGSAPWSLWWRRGASGWRLTGAGPVLE